MEKLYRKDYTGEFFIHSRIYANGSIKEDREWVPSTITEFPNTGNAVVIGNGQSRLELNLSLISSHRGGHLGKKKLTSYGCNALYRDFTPNFLIVNNENICADIVKSEFALKNIVYSSPKQILAHPGNFHLIPYYRFWNAGSIATWLACFDGMKKIYLLGFDGQCNSFNNNVYVGTHGYDNKDALVNTDLWVSTMYDIFTTYDDVDFVWVNPVTIPEQWRYAGNLRQATLRDFVVEADLGA